MSRNDSYKWSPEDGFEDESKKFQPGTSPRTLAGTGPKSGLIVSMNSIKSEYYCSYSSTYGFMVMVHASSEIPSMRLYGVKVANNYETDIIVGPHMSGGSENVKRISKNVRQCYFEDEISLEYFKYDTYI